MTESAGYDGGSSAAGGEPAQASAAFGVKQSFDAEVAAIRDSHTLNEEGKQAAIAEAYVGAEKKYNEAIERQETSAAERVREAEQAVFKVPSSSARAYREAYDRVKFAGFGEDRVVREKELSDMLAYAEKVGDSQLADALVQVCVEDGFDEIAERYLSVRPEKARKVEKHGHEY